MQVQEGTNRIIEMLGQCLQVVMLLVDFWDEMWLEISRCGWRTCGPFARNRELMITSLVQGGVKRLYMCSACEEDGVLMMRMDAGILLPGRGWTVDDVG